jgi:hypothetical protein
MMSGFFISLLSLGIVYGGITLIWSILKSNVWIATLLMVYYEYRNSNLFTWW